jgi:hypothetical protein
MIPGRLGGGVDNFLSLVRLPNSATFAKRLSRAGVASDFAGLSVGYFSQELFARRNQQE